jgi:glycosyltransferase involved in cell wall biosynthesis
VKISIITVIYNSELTIRDTFDSVLAQTYSDIEYIVVDGFSNDNTVDIIKEYEPKFKGRMHWISEPDKGLYDAMNKGIRMATGDVIGIINLPLRK